MLRAVTGLILYSFLCPVFSAEYILHAGRLIDVNTGRVHEQVSVSITDKTITGITPGYIEVTGDRQLLDLREYTVMPGLMDLHTHLSSELSPTSYTDRFYLSQADFALRASVYAKRTLLAGFTTVRDLGESEPGVSVALRNAINKGHIIGPRMFVAGKSIATTGGHADPSNGLRAELMADPGPAEGVINSPDDARKAVRQRYKDGADVIKLTVTGGVLSLAKSGDNPQFTDEELAAIMETAADYNYIVAVHAHGAAGMKRAIRAGVHSVEHGSSMDEEAVRLMKSHQTVYVPTLSAAYYVGLKAQQPGFLPDIVRPKALVASKQAQETFARAYKAGVKIAFGTDAGVFEHGQNATEFELMHQAGMPAIETIQTATLHAAALLQVTDQLGSVEAGKLADIIAVRGNPLEDITLMKQVGFVMKEGTIYKHE